ncbi:MAG: DoxX family protein [Planctomycetota bacterium]
MITADPLFLTCLIISSASFIFYGLSCLLSGRIAAEFERYKLQRFRNLVGSLQIVGSLGLIGGLWVSELGAAAALGLAVLMAMGVVVRLRLNDTAIQMLPAGAYLVLNSYLTIRFVVV